MSSGPASAAVALALFFAPAASAAAPPVENVGRASLSFYWIIDESSAQYRRRADALLRDVRGRVLASTSRKFRRELVLEGIGWLRDGRAVMYDRKKNGEHRFRIAKERNGLTVT